MVNLRMKSLNTLIFCRTRSTILDYKDNILSSFIKNIPKSLTQAGNIDASEKLTIHISFH